MNNDMMDMRMMQQPDMMLHGEAPLRKGILDRPSENYITDADILKILQTYIKPQIAPESKIANKFYEFVKYAFYSEHSTLTFYTMKEKERFLLDFEELWYLFCMTLRPGELRQEQRLYYLSALRSAEATFHRAVGTDKNVSNERTLQATSIVQNVSGNIGQPQMGGGGGFIRKMFGGR